MLHLLYDFENGDNCDTAGKTLRYYRIHKGYTTRELANILEIDRQLLLDDYTTFANYPCNVLLQEVRSKLSLNQSQMAQRIGIAPNAYSAWERATRTPLRKEYEKILPLIKEAYIKI